MTSPPFTLRQLEYFDAVASEGSMAAAAKRCHVSASALALALDELEQRMHVQLFVRRKGKGVVMTPAGARLLSNARRVLAEADSLTTDAWQVSTTLSGRFAIGCFSTLTPFFLPAIMEDFGSRYEQLELDLVEATAPTLTEMLLQGRLDAAILYDADVPGDLTFEALHEIRPYVMVAEDHRLAERRTVELGTLADEPAIMLEVHPALSNTERMFETLGLVPQVRHTTTSFELVRCLVARGQGYAVLFQRPASALTYEGRAVSVLEIEDDIPPTFVGLGRPADAPRTARHQALFEFLASQRDQPPQG